MQLFVLAVPLVCQWKKCSMLHSSASTLPWTNCRGNPRRLVPHRSTTVQVAVVEEDIVVVVAAAVVAAAHCLVAVVAQAAATLLETTSGSL